MCEICENASLLGKGLDNGTKSVQIPIDPRGIVERYSCDDEAKDCMLGNCDACQSYGLSETDFITESSVSFNSDSDSDTGSDVTIKFYHWHKSESRYLSKMQMTLDMSDALDRWQEVVTNLKSHIFNKRQQHSTYVNIRENLMERELLINLDFSENYSNRNQNEIQSAYFGNNSFSLFTAYAFYNNQGKTEKVSVTITTEGSDKSRVTSISVLDLLIQFLRSKIEKEIDTIHIFSDG